MNLTRSAGCGNPELDTLTHALSGALLARATAAKDAPPLLGIYEIDGDTFRACFAKPGKERPKDFECKAGSEHTLTVWKREKK